MMQCFLLPAMWSFFFFNDTATTEIYTLSLHDALPIWPEARLLHAHVCAALCRLQRPSNDGLQSPRRLIARSIPAIGESLIGFDDQYFAVSHAVPMRHGRSAEVEPMAHDRLKVVLHQPFVYQRALSDGAPDLF